MGSNNTSRAAPATSAGAGTVQIPNNRAEEITAGTTTVAGATPTPSAPVTGSASGSTPVSIPAPVITMSVSDPDALDNVKARTKKETARRGRNSLRIPLMQGGSAGSGIAIPV